VSRHQARDESAVDEGTLAGRATKALGWTFLNNMVGRFSTLGIGVALARILGPHEFGAFAVAMVALLALLSFNELGVSLAIVRWEGEPREIAPTVATISVISSVIIYAGCFVGAPAFAAAMGAPAAADVIRVLSVNVILDGLVSTPVALMQRYFKQKQKMIADQANNWIGTGTSIGLALLHFGAMSLAIGRLAGAAAAAVLFIVLSPQPLRFGFDPVRARELLRFGGPLAGASIVVFAVQNADEFVVGHVLGATALGFYALAFNLSGWPLTVFSMPIRTVAPALFSRLQHDKSAMRKTFLACLELVETATLPCCLLISAAAVPLVHFVYGASWAPAVQALVWLGGLAAIRIVFEYIYDFFVVLARSSVVFTVQVVWLVVLVPALIVGTRVYGIGGAAMAEVAVALIVVLPWYLAELGKVGIKRKPLLGRVWLPLLAAAAVAVAAHAIASVISQPFVACAVSGALTLVVIGLLGGRLWPVVTALRATLHEATTAEGGDAQPDGQPDGQAAGGGGQSEPGRPAQGLPPGEQAGPPWEPARPPWELEPSQGP
jgi:O-antigen/teichoic acid export membrane protein